MRVRFGRLRLALLTVAVVGAGGLVVLPASASASPGGPGPGPVSSGGVALPAADTGTPSSDVASGSFGSVAPFRVLDTRNGTGAPRAAVGKDSAIVVGVAGVGGVPVDGVAAVAVNVTVTQPVATGYLTVYASGTGRPTASNLNFVKGLTVANLVIAPVGADGKIAIYNGSPGTVQIVADIAGYYTAGSPAVAGAFGSVAPSRVLDTRNGTGAPKAAVAKDASIAVSVAGHGGVPATGVSAVAVNVTVTAPAATGYLSVYADGGARPTASNLNFVKAQTVPNLVMAPVGADGKIRIYNGSPGTVQIVADISGYTLAGLPSAAGTFAAITPLRVLDTRNGTGATKKAVPKDSSIAVSVAGLDNLPPTGIAAVAVNITATQPTTTGYLTVYADGTTRPTASNLNFVKRATVPNLVMAPVGTDGKIRIYNGSPGTIQIIADISGYTLAADRSASAVTSAPGTVTETADAAQTVTGDPDGTQTSVLAAGATVPAVAGTLVLPPSDAAPDGVIGTVTAVTDNGDGTTTVTTTPATLDQAYSHFETSLSENLTDADVTSDKTGMGTSTARWHVSPDSGLSSTLDNTYFDCSGSGAGPTITLTADMSDTHIDFDLNADPAAPNINFLFTSYPVFDLNVGFTGELTCQTKDWLKITIPVPSAPGLEVVIKPVFKITVGGQVSLQFEYAPRVAVGFTRGPGISSDVHAFGSSSSISLSSTVDADFFLGVSAELTLAGRVGVGGQIGPDLDVEYDASTACVTVTGALEVELDATAHVWVKDWAFAVAKGIFAKKTLYEHCPSGGGGGGEPPVITSTDLPHGSVGLPYTAQLTTADGRTGTWSIGNGKLPNGLSLSGHTITGTPTTAGTSNFTLTFTDTSDATATAQVSIVIAAAASGSQWTSVEAPLPSDAGADPDPVLGSAVCARQGSCYLTGTYTDTEGVTDPLLETWSQGQWTATKVPLPAGSTLEPYSGPSDLACADNGTCVLDGEFTDGTGAPQIFIDTLTADGWETTLPELDLPDGDTYVSDFFTVPSCGGDGTCVMAFTYADASGYAHGAIDTLTDSGWTMSEAPMPADFVAWAYVAFQPSCGSDGVCLTGFTYASSPDASQEMALDTLSNGVWTSTEAPLAVQTGTDRQFVDGRASCQTVAVCVVSIDVRSQETAVEQASLDVFSDGHWTAAAWPAQGGEPEDVFCDGGTTCYAVGANSTSALLDEWNDGSWSPVTPTGTAASDEYFEYGSCGGPDICAVSGSGLSDAGHVSIPVVAALSDGVWNATSPAIPEGYQSGYSTGPTCRSDGLCIAEITYQTSDSQNFTPEIYTLIDGQWSSADLPIPAGAAAYVGLGNACNLSGCVVVAEVLSSGIPILDSFRS